VKFLFSNQYKNKLMKSFYLSTIVVAILAITFSACGGSDQQLQDEARQRVEQQTPSVTPPPAAPIQTSPVAAGSVPHYQCPNNCQGGTGAAAGACPVCGTQMAHNQAYHDQQAAPQTSPTITTPTATPQPTNAAQNAAGVYHYTCSNGCAGGAGSAGPCPSCGTQLVHNQAYHN
jgi:hypothetical protein